MCENFGISSGTRHPSQAIKLSSRAEYATALARKLCDIGQHAIRIHADGGSVFGVTELGRGFGSYAAHALDRPGLGCSNRNDESWPSEFAIDAHASEEQAAMTKTARQRDSTSK